MFESLEDRAMLAAGVTPVFAVTNDWGSGYQAELKLNNQQSTGVANWKLEFDMPSNITSIWDAQDRSHTGNHYVIAGANWNNNLAAGGACRSDSSPRRRKPVAPTNYLLDGSRARRHNSATTAANAQPVDHGRHVNRREQRHDVGAVHVTLSAPPAAR